MNEIDFEFGKIKANICRIEARLDKIEGENQKNIDTIYDLLEDIKMITCELQNRSMNVDVTELIERSIAEPLEEIRRVQGVMMQRICNIENR